MEVPKTYVWFSPLGARIHAPAQKSAVTMRPMKGAQLRCELACCKLSGAGGGVCAYPFAILKLRYV